MRGALGIWLQPPTAGRGGDAGQVEGPTAGRGGDAGPLERSTSRHREIVYTPPRGTLMHLAKKLDRTATLADLNDLPPTWRGEILDGELYAFPRARANHANIADLAIADLKNPFQRGRGGPGGWWILSSGG